MRVSQIARRSKQSILKEINREYSLEGLVLKLKLQCFGHRMQRVDSLEKILMLGKIEGKGEGDATENETAGLHHQLNGHENLSKAYFSGKEKLLPAKQFFTVTGENRTVLDLHGLRVMAS